MQYKLQKTTNGWRFTLGNITTFFNDLERQELIAALIYEDLNMADRMAEFLAKKHQVKHAYAISLFITNFLANPEKFYGWQSPHQLGSTPIPEQLELPFNKKPEKPETKPKWVERMEKKIPGVQIAWQKKYQMKDE